MKLKFTMLVLMIACLISFPMLFSCVENNPYSTAMDNQDTVTVKFDSNGGGDLEKQIINIGEYIKEPTTPQRNGYTFEGWFNGDKKWDFAGSVKNDMTLTAKWTVIEYSITYVGGLCDLNKYTVEDEFYFCDYVAMPQENFTFVNGWFADKELTKPVSKISKGTYGDLTLYAKADYTPLSYRLSSDKAYMIVTGCDNDATDITIPSTFGNKPVLAIEKYAFYGHKKLQSIMIEDGPTEIGENAFGRCSAKVIVLPKTLKTIGRGAFAYSDLFLIQVPNSVTEIGDNAFFRCSSLLYAYLGTGISSIPSMLFEGCTSLMEVDLYGSIATINQRAFYGCSSLSILYLGSNKLKHIENNAFNGCNSLKQIFIPSSVTYIGMHAFSVDDGYTLTVYCETDELSSGWSPYWLGSNCTAVYLFETKSIKLPE